MKTNSIVMKTDSIVIKIDSICATFDSIVSTIDLVKKTSSMQNNPLDRVPRSTQYLLILSCSSQSFNNRGDSGHNRVNPYHNPFFLSDRVGFLKSSQF